MNEAVVRFKKWLKKNKISDYRLVADVLMKGDINSVKKLYFAKKSEEELIRMGISTGDVKILLEKLEELSDIIEDNPLGVYEATSLYDGVLFYFNLLEEYFQEVVDSGVYIKDVVDIIAYCGESARELRTGDRFRDNSPMLRSYLQNIYEYYLEVRDVTPALFGVLVKRRLLTRKIFDLFLDTKKIHEICGFKHRSYSVQKIEETLIDPDSITIWKMFKDADIENIQWDSFIQVYQTVMGNMSLSDEVLFRETLNITTVDFVTMNEINDYVKRYGPLKNAFKKCKELCNEDWFQPNCDQFVSHKLLEHYGDGTFLVRYYFGEQGTNFIIEYLKDGNIRHKIVNVDYEKGLSIGSNEFKDFKSILDLYQADLNIPIPLDIISKPWFSGYYEIDEFEKTLRFEWEGTFLVSVAPENTEAFFIITFVGKKGITSLVLVEGSDEVYNYGTLKNGKIVLNQERSYESVEDFLSCHTLTLKYSYHFDRVPVLKCAPFIHNSNNVEYFGPEETTDPVDYDPYFSCQTVATYPNHSKGYDVICDKFHIKCYGNRTIFCVTDGCSWGAGPREAARRAAKTFIDYFSSQDVQNNINDFVTAKEQIRKTIKKMEKSIFEGEKDPWMCGQTTFIGGLMMRIKDGHYFEEKWGCVLMSVGDCKAYYYKPTQGVVEEISKGNRGNVHDARDCGGRLGAYVFSGESDLRNLEFYFVPCDPGDIILLCSDGVHDNLDPETLGWEPYQLSSKYNVEQYLEWNSVPDDKAMVVKSKFSSDTIKSLYDDVSLPSAYTRKLIDYCLSTTKNKREFMETHPDDKEPDDKENYPGKMDHTTCLTLRAGLTYTDNSKNRLKILKSSNKKKTNSVRVKSKKREVIHWDRILESTLTSFANEYSKFEAQGELLGEIHSPQNNDHATIETVLNCSNIAAGCCTSLFPDDPDGVRYHDPIVEGFSMEEYSDRTILVVTSGRNYDTRYRDAALLAKDIFNCTLQEIKIDSLYETVTAVVNACKATENALMKVEDMDMVNSISLVGGIVLPLDTFGSSSKWLFVCAGIGDCKAYHWKNLDKSVVDITEDNIPESFGYFSSKSINIYVKLINPEDKIILMTPAVYNNCDPLFLGIEFSKKKWKKELELREKHILQMIENIIRPNRKNVKKIVDAIIQNCKTQSEDLKKNYTNPTVESYGCLGHITCLAWSAIMYDNEFYY